MSSYDFVLKCIQILLIQIALIALCIAAKKGKLKPVKAITLRRVGKLYIAVGIFALSLSILFIAFIVYETFSGVSMGIAISEAQQLKDRCLKLLADLDRIYSEVKTSDPSQYSMLAKELEI